MTQILIAIFLILSGVFFTFIAPKISNKKIGLCLKIISVLIFGLYTYRIFGEEYLDTAKLSNTFLSQAEFIFVFVLRWLSAVGVLFACVVSFFDIKALKNISVFITLPLVILNLAFFNLNLKAIVGNVEVTSDTLKLLGFAFEIALVGVVGIYFLLEKIKTKDFKQIDKQIGTSLLVFLGGMLAMFPLNFFIAFFGNLGIKAEGFNLIHRIVIYLSFIFPIAIVLIFSKKELKVRKSVLVFLAIASFFQYFIKYTPSNLTVTNVPLHLCNTAILLMLIAYVFNLKPVYYFTYLINVSGALFAILLPDNVGFFGNFSAQGFWFNHWYAFFLPLLGVGLKVFPRPNFKMVRGAIYIFTIYIIFVAFMNAWFNNFASVDYFFLYKNFIVDKFPFLRPLKENFIWIFSLGGLTFKIYWLYVLIVYFAYIGFIFLAWIIYSYIFKVTDHYAELFKYRNLDALEIKKLKKQMNGKPLTSPLFPKGVNMIKISNFSKRYGNSKNFAVKDLNLEIKKGEVFGFLGHNGSGKSTTIKSLVGIQDITEGSMSVCGYDIKTQPLQAKMQIGYVSDNHVTYEHLTGREFVNYIADLYNVSLESRKERFDKYVEMFKLTDAVDREIKSYSHGMKQKIVVIASLIHNPKVWVLDEPLTGLDPESAFQIKNCITDHAKQGNIVFFSSHVIEVVEKVCDRIAIIKQGELQGVYKIKDLHKQNKSLEELYMGYK